MKAPENTAARRARTVSRRAKELAPTNQNTAAQRARTVSRRPKELAPTDQNTAAQRAHTVSRRPKELAPTMPLRTWHRDTDLPHLASSLIG